MKTKHTPEPWRLEEDLIVTDEFQIAQILSNKKRKKLLKKDKPDADRIIDCVNACKGISNPEAIPDILAAAKLALDECCDLIGTKAGIALENAIAKANGKHIENTSSRQFSDQSVDTGN